MGHSTHIARRLQSVRRYARAGSAAGDNLILSLSKLIISASDGGVFINPVTLLLTGGFGSGELPKGMINGREYASVFNTYVETTGYTETIAGNWTVSGGASLTADQIVSPDVNKLADKLTFPADSTAYIQSFITCSDNENQVVSVFARTASGTKDFRIRVRDKNNVYHWSSTFTATTEWQRFDFTKNIGAGVATTVFRIYNDGVGVAGDLYVWGASHHKDCSYPKGYMTNDTGAGQTRAADVAYWPAAVIPESARTEGFRFWWMPAFADDENTAAQGPVLYQFKDAATSKELFLQWEFNNSKKLKVAKKDGGYTTLVESASLAFSRSTVIAGFVNAVTGELTVSGATSGNGKTSGTAWDDFIPAASNLYIGCYGGSSMCADSNLTGLYA